VVAARVVPPCTAHKKNTPSPLGEQIVGHNLLIRCVKMRVLLSLLLGVHLCMAQDWTSLSAQLTGSLILPSSSDFTTDSQQWNADYDTIKPQAVAYTITESDVQACVQFATANNVQVSVRSGGHSFAGYSVCDQCLVIDTSKLEQLNFDLDKQVVYAGPGVNLETFTRTAGQYNVTVPIGFGPTVHLGGFTLGGGIGLTHRKYGMTIDNLVSARVVLASGEAVVASADSNPDLFWGLRGGGGGNFGIVTEYVFTTHKVSDQVLHVNIHWPFSEDNVVKVASAWRDTFTSPDITDDFCLYWRIEGSPFGTYFYKIEVFGVWTGDVDVGKQLVEDLITKSGVGTNQKDLIVTTYVDAYLRFMTPYEKVPRVGFKSKSLMMDNPPTDEFFKTLASQISKQWLLQNFPLLWIEPFGGSKIPAVDPADTAYPHRNVFGNFMIINFWLTSGNKANGLNWLDETMNLTSSTFADRAYVNFIDSELEDWQHYYYRDNYPRLQTIKAQYDSQNVFHFAQSIELPQSIVAEEVTEDQ
jgi:FAD/FMN-containing dehydrogenase